jgi:D-alanyl-D-alanine carboxypeptidase/D-alanyl-D-alanine-endopeptidase (penicillin-binding protein 4)
MNRIKHYDKERQKADKVETSLERHFLTHLSTKILSGCRRCGSILWLVLLLPPYHAWGSSVAIPEVDNGGYIVRQDVPLVQHREQELFIPASTLKILTSLIALEKLGKDYRFETHFFVDEQNNLYIKGYGDPFLTSETLLEIGNKIAALGITRIGSIFLDESSFLLNGETASVENSANPYDAPNGALAVNFNALPVYVGKDATISAGEPQTPLIAMMQEAGADLPQGRHRINVGTLSQPGLLSPALRYTGELFVAQFQHAGISVEKGYSEKIVPKGWKPIYIHRGSHSLEEIVRACLKTSNNYIANQLFLACGAKYFGLPATWDKSRRVFAVFAEKSLQLSAKQIFVAEGSGLSRQNRISPVALLAILDLFKPYSSLLNQKNDVLLKSGTMKDIYCYAGYFAQGSELTPFAILLNQRQNNRDSVLEALHLLFRLRKFP